MKKLIFKVQLPLFSSDGSGDVMIYNEDESIMEILPVRSEKELKELKDMLGDYPKGYFYGKKEKDEKGKIGIILTGKAPWQDW